MSENKNNESHSAAVPDGVGDAVGVEKSKWFIAVVNNNTEKATAGRLTTRGIENYLPSQTVVRVWRNGRKARIERVVIPSVIFIRCTEPERREIVKLPYINRFMTNKAGDLQTSGFKPLATVSDSEIRQLKFMLGQSDIPVTVTTRPYRLGDRVRVIRGGLMGLEGEVVDLKSSKSELTVSLPYFGCALLTIDTVNLEVIHK